METTPRGSHAAPLYGVIVDYFLAILNFGNFLWCSHILWGLSGTLQRALNLRVEMKADLIGVDAFIELEKTFKTTSAMVDSKENIQALIVSITKHIRSMYRMELGLFLLITYAGCATIYYITTILSEKGIL